VPDNDYLVDPLEIGDISPLGAIFSSPKIEKIFHAAEYDIIVLKQDFQFEFQKLFDTMLAARILGWKSFGLSSILKSEFGISVNKKYQRANWGRRPIPTEMLAYAQVDTHYLIPLRERMKSELVSVNRWDLAQEDFHRLCHVSPNQDSKKGVDPWRINGARDLDSKQVAVLSELCKFRDAKARELDRPLFKVIGDQSLIKIATASPVSIKTLETIPGISQKQVRWIGRGLLSAMKRGLNNQPPKRPKKRRHDPAYINRVEVLRTWRKETARGLDVESDVVLPKDLLYALAKSNPKNNQEMNKILVSVPWRKAKFGDTIFDLLKSS
jgi:ribonuclease D